MWKMQSLGKTKQTNKLISRMSSFFSPTGWNLNILGQQKFNVVNFGQQNLTLFLKQIVIFYNIKKIQQHKYSQKIFNIKNKYNTPL